MPKKTWGTLQERGGSVFEGVDTPMPTMISLNHFELSRIDVPKLNSSIVMEIVTIPVGQVDEFYFYMQVTSIKKMLVLSVKFTLLFSGSPICIPLILLSELMRLAGTSVAVLHNNLDSRHHWRTHTGVRGSKRRPFVLILDSILVFAN